jgi:hypothetical protein
VQTYRLLTEMGNLSGRSLQQHIGHALSAVMIYLTLVDLPSVVGGTTPTMAAGQAALASTAITQLLAYVNRVGYEAGMNAPGDTERRFLEYAKQALAELARWGARGIRNAPAELQGSQDMLTLRRQIEDVQSSAFARHAQIAGDLGLLLGQSPVVAGRVALEGRRPQAALAEEPSGGALGSGSEADTEQLTAHDTARFTPMAEEVGAEEEEIGPEALAPMPRTLTTEQRRKAIADMESRTDLRDPLLGRRGRGGSMRYAQYQRRELRLYKSENEVRLQLMIPTGEGELSRQLMNKKRPTPEDVALRERIFEKAVMMQPLTGIELMAVRDTVVLGTASAGPAPPSRAGPAPPSRAGTRAPTTPGRLRPLRSPERSTGASGSGLPR